MDSGEVRVQKLSHAVADRLRAQIVSGQRKAGDRLPPESELLAQFNVSRPTIREALRILEVESLIALGRGVRTGATVLGPTVGRAAEYAGMLLVSDGTTVGELHEVRSLLEPSMIQQLAVRRDTALIVQLQAHLDASKEAIDVGRYPAALEQLDAFHAALVRASGNRALNLIVDMLKVLTAQGGEVLLEVDHRDRQVLHANLERTLAAYQKLVELLKTGCAQDARAFWVRYMGRAGTFLRKTGIDARPLQHR